MKSEDPLAKLRLPQTGRFVDVSAIEVANYKLRKIKRIEHMVAQGSAIVAACKLSGISADTR